MESPSSASTVLWKNASILNAFGRLEGHGLARGQRSVGGNFEGPRARVRSGLIHLITIIISTISRISVWFRPNLR